MAAAAEEKHWNPRYVAYAKAHGHPPEGMMERDRGVWPGDYTVGFMFWNMVKWDEFMKEFHPEVPQEFKTLHGEEYTEWLSLTVAFGEVDESKLKKTGNPYV